MAGKNSSGIGDELNNEMTMSVLPVTVFIAIEAVVGFFGNIIILLVYFKRYRRINFRYFVLALAIVDLISCCTTLPGEIFSQLNWYRYEHGWICKVKSYFNVFTAWASASILLSLAIDRYRKICHPFNWQIRVRVAFRLCGCCFLVSALVASPVAELWGKMTYIYTYKDENITVSVCEKSGDYANTLYPLIYVWCVYLVPVSIMILVAMTLNFITAWKLFGHQSTKLDVAKDHQMHTATSTVMMTESFDKDTDDESLATPSHLSEKNQKKLKKQGITNTSENRSDAPHTTSQPSNSNVDKRMQVDPVTYSKGKQQLSDTFGDGKNKKRQIQNDKYSTDEEISIGYFSGNTQSDDKTLDHTTAEVSKKPDVHQNKSYRKTKTMIMLVLTSIFAVTMALYIILTVFVAKPGGILKYMPDSEKAVFFFFWRLYFTNSVVNPILYGFMDARFRSGLMTYLPKTIRIKIMS